MPLLIRCYRNTQRNLPKTEALNHFRNFFTRVWRRHLVYNVFKGQYTRPQNFELLADTTELAAIVPPNDHPNHEKPTGPEPEGVEGDERPRLTERKVHVFSYTFADFNATLGVLEHMGWWRLLMRGFYEACVEATDATCPSTAIQQLQLAHAALLPLVKQAKARLELRLVADLWAYLRWTTACVAYKMDKMRWPGLEPMSSGPLMAPRHDRSSLRYRWGAWRELPETFLPSVPMHTGWLRCSS